jgi:lipopolysaccharide transport system permease protein
MESSTPTTNHLAVTINQPIKGWSLPNLAELWKYRDLFLFLVWKDIRVRYKQTVMGFGWAIIQPFSTMVVFSVVFGQIAQIPSDGVPYPLFSYAGLLPWTLFTSSMSHSTQSLVSSAGMMKKVYFPRIILPVANAITGVVDFLIAFLVLIGMMIYYGVIPTINILWLPVFLLLTFTASLAIGIWLAALNVQFRDVQYLIPFVVRLGLFVTPVLYPSNLVSDTWKIIYSLNPMVGVIEGFRWALLGTSAPHLSMLLASSAVTGILLISGLYYFQRMETLFADIV